MRFDDGHVVRYENGAAFADDIPLSDGLTQCGSFFVYVFAHREATYVRNETLRIGAGETCDIRIEGAGAELLLTGHTLSVTQGVVYLNGVRRGVGVYRARRGDCLLIGAVLIYIDDRTVVCDGDGYETTLLQRIETSEIDEDYPHYKRSPRIVKPEPTDRVEIREPPAKQEKKRGAILTILMPVAMVCVTIALGVVMGRGLMVLMSAAMMTASAVFSIVRLFNEKRDAKEKEEKRVADYQAYLLQTRKRLNGLYQAQSASLKYHYPTDAQIEEMTLARSGRIYEHAANDADFLCFSVGRSVMPSSYQISFNNDRLKSAGDELLREMQEIATAYTTLSDMPTAIDLKRTHLAYVGEKELIHAQLKTLVAQIAFFQSYHDVNLILLTDEASAPSFEWMRWLPHCRLHSINTLTLISTENQRDKILGNLASALKERRMRKDEQKMTGVFLPHYFFIVDHPKLIASHSIMEYLQSDDMELGFSVIFSTHLRANVPENIRTVVSLNGRGQATLLLKEGRFVNQPVQTDETGADYEAIARGLCPLIHNKGVTTRIPDLLTFFEMYGVSRPQEIDIVSLWKNAACHKSLAVPLGARAKDDYVYLNLHEKAHGPHGLVAGTTGSGKSEAIQSFILSLAVNFHPYDVGFLLIDYKGGGMAKLFENLPHLLGIITNLDGSESMRALASIRSELARRQRVFNENGVNNINDYTKLFKSGEASEPLPHLFIISDEFAELKKEQPEFMKELVSTARIGRSLGVHLILATQKPTGVVDDQIWSNSRFKLALKVQNEADSNEILKTPDAARITQSGRAYLQIGNNEIYELFQTAWSGAPYRAENASGDFDERIYLENASGQGELLNVDLTDSVGDGMTKTQLDVMVDYIADAYGRMKLPPVAKPWLESLPETMTTPYVMEAGDVATCLEYDLRAHIGVADVPEKQTQTEFVHDFMQDGNLAFFGASGYGKSVCMTTVAMELASHNSPERLHFYILDFGNSSLIPLKGLPHTADYMTYDDAEKLEKLIRLMTDEMSLRKRLFAKTNAVSFKMYNQSAENPLPAIVMEIDNYDVVKEMGTQMDEFIVKLTRDGNGVGMYTVLSASRANAVRYATLNNFKTKIALYSFDVSDLIAAVGRSQYALTEVRGRALVKLDEPHIMQCYLPVPYESDVQYAENLRYAIDRIANNCTARRPDGIAVLPETAYFNMLTLSAEERYAAIGLDADTVETRYMDLSQPVQLIVGAPQTGKTNVLKLLVAQLQCATVFIADGRAMELQALSARDNITLLKDAETFLRGIETAIELRRRQFESSGQGQISRVFYATLPPLCLLIDDVDFFLETVKPYAQAAETALFALADVGGCIVATTAPSRLRGFDNLSKYIKETQNGMALGAPADQQQFSIITERGYRARIDMGFFVERGMTAKTMIPEAP